MKKLYIVKHEVLAKSITEAMRIKTGNIYEISLADEKYQPQPLVPKVGFNNKKKKQ